MAEAYIFKAAEDIFFTIIVSSEWYNLLLNKNNTTVVDSNNHITSFGDEIAPLLSLVYTTTPYVQYAFNQTIHDLITSSFPVHAFDKMYPNQSAFYTINMKNGYFLYLNTGSSSSQGYSICGNDFGSASTSRQVTFGAGGNDWGFKFVIMPDDYSDYRTIELYKHTNYMVTQNTVKLYVSKFSTSGNAHDWLHGLILTNKDDRYHPPEPDPYDQLNGESALPGDETVGLPSEPTLTPIDAGLFSLYSPTVQQMKNLADFLWTDFGGAGTTVEQVLEEVVEALKRSVSNPLNSMLGLSIIASQGLNKGSDSSVHIGFWNTGVSMTRLNKQYFTVDCGSVTMQPVCGNTFLDYAPYSKFSIFLPYVGMRILDANDVVGHTISVKYRGDAVSGALICFIQRDGQIIAEHAGNCALNLPLTADSWAETIAGVGRMISGAASGALSGSSPGDAAARGAIKGAASVATNPSAFSPQVSHVGNVAGSAGHMGSQKPFILREAVRFHSTEGFNSIIGYPSYYYRRLGDCRGYTQCLDVHLSHTPATGDELKEIEELLKQGVII